MFCPEMPASFSRLSSLQQLVLAPTLPSLPQDLTGFSLVKSLVLQPGSQQGVPIYLPMESNALQELSAQGHFILHNLQHASRLEQIFLAQSSFKILRWPRSMPCLKSIQVHTLHDLTGQVSQTVDIQLTYLVCPMTGRTTISLKRCSCQMWAWAHAAYVEEAQALLCEPP